jgi:cardiolipin synthase
MSVFTAANQLTLLRLALVPVFALCVFYGLHGWALVTFVAAGLTDVFDGLLARRLGQPTVLGAWLDPVADKVLVLTMFVMLTVPGLGEPNRLPLWLTVLVISRDVAIVLTVAIFNLAVARRTFRPTLLGKVATATYVTTGVVALFGNYRGEPLVLVSVCAYSALAITLLSGFHYALMVMRPAPAGDA